MPPAADPSDTHTTSPPRSCDSDVATLRRHCSAPVAGSSATTSPFANVATYGPADTTPPMSSNSDSNSVHHTMSPEPMSTPLTTSAVVLTTSTSPTSTAPSGHPIALVHSSSPVERSKPTIPPGPVAPSSHPASPTSAQKAHADRANVPRSTTTTPARRTRTTSVSHLRFPDLIRFTRAIPRTDRRKGGGRDQSTNGAQRWADRSEALLAQDCSDDIRRRHRRTLLARRHRRGSPGSPRSAHLRAVVRSPPAA